MKLIQEQEHVKSERRLAEVLDVTNTDVRRWKSGSGSPDIEVFERAAACLHWSMDRLVAYLNGKSSSQNLSAKQIIDQVEEMPLAEVAEIVEAGVSRLAAATKTGAIMSHRKLSMLVEEQLETVGIQKFARKVKLSQGELRKILSGEISGNPKTKLGNLAPHLVNPETNRPFVDWEDLATFCEIFVASSNEPEDRMPNHENGHLV